MIKQALIVLATLSLTSIAIAENLDSVEIQNLLNRNVALVQQKTSPQVVAPGTDKAFGNGGINAFTAITLSDGQTTPLIIFQKKNDSTIISAKAPAWVRLSSTQGVLLGCGAKNSAETQDNMVKVIILQDCQSSFTK